MKKLFSVIFALALAHGVRAQTVTNIAYVRTFVDDINYLPLDITNIFTVEGIVTTHVNLANGNDALFFIQDATAGIAVFVSGGATQVPRAGAKVLVSAPLSHSSGLLDLKVTLSNPDHTLSLLSINNPLPDPTPLVFSWSVDPATIEAQEGKYVVASNVFLDLSAATFNPAGENVIMTNDLGENFILQVDPHTDIGGQVRPTTPVTIFGVLSQVDASGARVTGYELLPTRFSDFLTSAGKPPSLRFTNILSRLVRPGDAPTNSFSELVVRAGEKLTLQVSIKDPEGRTARAEPTTTLPPAADWVLPAPGTNITSVLTFEPSPGDAGSNYVFGLNAVNDAGTNVGTWTVYVPTPAEENIIISEFLANPPTNPSTPHFNPLRRDFAPSNISVNDEYIELVNLGPADIDLVGWNVSDASALRHFFISSFMIQSSNAAIVYGGPRGAPLPNLDVPFIASSADTGGLSLNNTDIENILLRNANSNLIERLIYDGSDLSPEGSLARAPDLNSPFVAQISVSTNRVTPGRQFDGRLFSEAAIPAGSAPVIGFTNTLEHLVRPGDQLVNTFSETALRPGEQLTVRVGATDPNGRAVGLLLITNGIPASSSWTPVSGVSGTLVFIPTSEDAGSNYIFSVQATNDITTTTTSWSVYVPSAVEQGLVISEFLANPTSKTNDVFFNPLNRATPAPNPSTQDEFIELVNISDTALDLLNWTISDATDVRHLFTAQTLVQSSNAIVIYGGPQTGFDPTLPVLALPASSGGLSLQNTGTELLTLHNADNHLVVRLFYRGGSGLSDDGSRTRFPTLNSDFVDHFSISTNHVSPGLMPNGQPFNGSGEPNIPVITVSVAVGDPGTIVLNWNADPSRTYSVHAAPSVNQGFTEIVSGLQFSSSEGHYPDSSPGQSARFYLITSP